MANIFIFPGIAEKESEKHIKICRKIARLLRGMTIPLMLEQLTPPAEEKYKYIFSVYATNYRKFSDSKLNVDLIYYHESKLNPQRRLDIMKSFLIDSLGNNQYLRNNFDLEVNLTLCDRIGDSWDSLYYQKTFRKKVSE